VPLSLDGDSGMVEKYIVRCNCVSTTLPIRISDMNNGITVVQIEFLLLVAATVAITARRLRLPYSAGLVLAGFGLAFLPFGLQTPLTKDLIFSVFLPPLIFEASLYIRWRELRRDLPLLLVLVTVGMMVSAALTATGMHFLIGWEWPGAVLFGALIAATDPVSVIATFKETGVHGRLRMLAEAESIFNDGTAAVAFSVALAIITGGPWDSFTIAQTLLTSVSGGLFCGALVAGGILLMAGRTEDHLVEIALTTIAAYGSFLLAEHFRLSGVLATMTAGIIIGNIGSPRALSAKGREAVESFWEYVAFVVNSLIFILIGMHEAKQNFQGALLPIVAGIAVVMAGRAAAIYPCCALLGRFFVPVRMSHRHVLFWGGLRGALALALSLGLPPEIPHRNEIVTVAFAVVAFSIFVQGATMAPLLRRLGELPAPHD
jgi:CPA1 family monovalent cation:H+ antiporter